MQTRITLIACFDNKSIKEIEEKLKLLDGYKLCKVPLHTANREENDTLPFHITLSAWNIEKENFIVEKMNALQFAEKSVVFEFAYVGCLLYLKPVDESSIRNLQVQAYNLLPTEKYNPQEYMLHSTMNINSDCETIKKQCNLLKGIKLTLKIKEIRLYEIYPAKCVAKTYAH